MGLLGFLDNYDSIIRNKLSREVIPITKDEINSLIRVLEGMDRDYLEGIDKSLSKFFGVETMKGTVIMVNNLDSCEILRSLPFDRLGANIIESKVVPDNGNFYIMCHTDVIPGDCGEGVIYKPYPFNKDYIRGKLE